MTLYCIGAQKAGTSWLHRHLSSHPQIAFPLNKEPHYWDAVESGKKPRDDAAYWQAFESLPAGIIGVDCTPAYATLSMDTVRDVAGVIPDLKLIFMLRNPVDRAWSAAQMYRRMCHLQPREVSEQWYLDVFRSAASLGRGDYAQTLDRWWSAFDRAALAIIHYEELGSQPRDCLKRVAKFIEITEAPFLKIPEPELRERVNAGDRIAIPQSLRRALLELYQPRVEKLGRMTGRDYSAWLTDSG